MGIGVPVATTVKMIVPPAFTVVLAGCVVMTGARPGQVMSWISMSIRVGGGLPAQVLPDQLLTINLPGNWGMLLVAIAGTFACNTVSGPALPPAITWSPVAGWPSR